MKASSIKSITPRREATVAVYFYFVATLRTDKGDVEVPVDAAALQSFQAFRKAVLEKSGIWFDAPEFEGRDAKRNWSEEMTIRITEVAK